MPLIQYLPFGQLVQEYRHEHHWTQEELGKQTIVAARLLNESEDYTRDLSPYGEISSSAIAAIEQGIRRPHPRRSTVDVLAVSFWPNVFQQHNLVWLQTHYRPCQLFYEAWKWSTMSSSLGLTLPPLEEVLFGRETEMQAALALIQEQTTRLVTINGPGGIGKTHFVLELAHALDIKHEVVWVPCGVLAEAHLFPSLFLRRLGISEIYGVAILEQFKTALAERPVLAFIDNFEQILEASSWLQDLLLACPLLACVVTSRVPLKIAGEHLLSLPPLAVPVANAFDDISALSKVDAITFFLAQARRILPELSLTEETAPYIVELCRSFAGVPLAMLLVIPALRVMSLQSLCQRIKHDVLNLLEEQTGMLPERQQTMRNTISWSYHLLGAREQRLFRLLSIPVGGVTLATLLPLCDPSLDTEVPILLSSLVQQGFLMINAYSGEEYRYHLHPLLQEYGREMLEVYQESASIQQKFVSYWLWQVNTLNKRDVSEDTSDLTWRDLIGDEEANLQEVMQIFISTQMVAEGLLYLHDLARPWRYLGRAAEGRGWAKALLQRVQRDTPIEQQAWGHFELANFAFWMGNYKETYYHARRSFSLFEQMKDRKGIAQARVYIANGAINLDRCDEAISILQTGLIEIENQHLPREEGYLLLSLGCVLLEQNTVDEARKRLLQCQAIFQTVNDVWGGGRASLYLSRCYPEIPDYQQELLKTALDQARVSAFPTNVAEILVEFARLLIQRNQKAQAKEYTHEAIMIFEMLQDKWGLAITQKLLFDITSSSLPDLN